MRIRTYDEDYRNNKPYPFAIKIELNGFEQGSNSNYDSQKNLDLYCIHNNLYVDNANEKLYGNDKITFLFVFKLGMDYIDKNILNNSFIGLIEINDLNNELSHNSLNFKLTDQHMFGTPGVVNGHYFKMQIYEVMVLKGEEYEKLSNGYKLLNYLMVSFSNLN